jgi:3-oxoadipate enol-lactonase
MSNFNYKGKIFYQSSNIKSTETLVFLHGFSLDHRIWEPQVNEFQDKYNILVYDLRGFGKSSIPTETYSHYDDLFELLNFLDIKHVHLVGLSMGGRIAVDFVLEHPSYVKTLTLLDSSLGGYKSTVDFSITVENTDIEQARQKWLSHEVFAYTRKNIDVSNSLAKIVEDYSGWHWQHKKLYENAVPDAKYRLKEIKCLTNILVGEYDLQYFKDIAEYMNSQIPTSKYQLVPNSGHMTNMENPNFVNKVILENL